METPVDNQQIILTYKGQEFILTFELLDGDVIHLVLKCRNSIIKRQSSQSFKDILKEYPFVGLIYDSAQTFMGLLPYSAEQKKIQMIEDRLVELIIILGHQEKRVQFVFIDDKPSDSDITNSLQSLVNRIVELENTNAQMKKQIQDWSSEFGRLVKFNFKSPDKSHIEILKDGASAKKLTSDYVFVGVIGDQPVYLKGKTHFEVIIDQTGGSCNIMVGFVSKNDTHSGGYYTKQSGHMYYCANGYFYRASSTVLLQSHTCKAGDRVKAVFDADEMKVSYYVNDNKMGSPQPLVLDKSEIKNMYPCVDLYELNEQVTVISKISIKSQQKQ